MELPSISSYGRYSSNNYGAHTLQVSMAGLTVYFSYRTPVAFRGRGHDLTVCQNAWGPTTRKHLNWIDGGNGAVKRRLPRAEFQRLLAEVQSDEYAAENYHG